MSELGDLYQEVILHHNKSPRNYGVLEDANRTADGHNPLCGDRLHLMVRLEDDVLADVRFVGEGCAISKASASVMTDTLKGKTAEEAQRMFDAFHAVVTGATPEDDAPELGKLEVFAGVGEFPARVKCAMLAWRTLESALSDDHTTACTE